MNEATRLPAHLRFDLRELSEVDSVIPSHEPDADPSVVQRRIQELRDDLAHELITAEEYAHKVDQLHATQPVIPKRSLVSLEAKTPHSIQIPDPAPEGLMLGEHAPGYMSPVHEEEYLLATDSILENPAAYDPNAHDGRPLRIPPSQPIPNDKDLTLRNPDSVYNWLRKNQPQVFLQDKDPQHHENLSEKSSARPGNAPGRGKRPSGVGAGTPGPKTDQDPDDEIGFIPETGTGSSKRKRGMDKDDDSAYRPKGGASRPGKRKREEGDTPVGKGGRKKANRASGGATAS
ncbi:IEC3 subunit of the Ino80 complex, chromatin re-modelling-domain-containing protein [Clohesyomyces aquaticus]|uniref:IEC3 subunit of the Ino80 complex, chromatin re-modelling-domain-containing protein n=1 Tax=Clohesyomyces aquaticus TaxID=1231657 RepID=A0A1Y1ZDX9_9PLEO|nr:IEC3 subunit of the Ino80 complex, chromatin re-modelling-domain-containing protein [Clohesyomyces aquaticus]